MERGGVGLQSSEMGGEDWKGGLDEDWTRPEGIGEEWRGAEGSKGERGRLVGALSGGGRCRGKAGGR